MLSKENTKHEEEPLTIIFSEKLLNAGQSSGKIIYIYIYIAEFAEKVVINNSSIL